MKTLLTLENLYRAIAQKPTEPPALADCFRTGVKVLANGLDKIWCNVDRRDACLALVADYAIPVAPTKQTSILGRLENVQNSISLWIEANDPVAAPGLPCPKNQAASKAPATTHRPSPSPSTNRLDEIMAEHARFKKSDPREATIFFRQHKQEIFRLLWENETNPGRNSR